MSETQSNAKKATKQAQTYEVTDLATPFAGLMKMWHEQAERVFAQTEQGLERSFEASRKMLEEQGRLATAQMNASQDAMRVLAEGMQRMTKPGTES